MNNDILIKPFRLKDSCFPKPIKNNKIRFENIGLIIVSLFLTMTIFFIVIVG
jgi:hypothetical protein